MAVAASRFQQAFKSETSDESKRWGRRIGVAAAVTAVTGSLFWLGEQLTAPDVMPIRTVRVEGVFVHVEPERVKTVVARTLTGNFINANVAEVREAVEAMPWVRGATVQRMWPAGLEVTVHEHMPLARWNGKGLVNRDGQVFDPNGVVLEGLPTFNGPDGSSENLTATYRHMNTALAPLELAIVGLTMNPRRAWSVTLNNGIELVLGRRDRDERLQRFVRIYPATLAAEASRIERVDLRYPNGFAVQWKDAQAKASTKVVA